MHDGMNFRKFLSALNNCFTSTFNYIVNTINTILSTNWGKLATCIVILPLLILVFFKLFELVNEILKIKIDNEINVVVKDKKQKGKNGDNSKKENNYN